MADTISFRRGCLADLDVVTANNIAMAKETEDLDLPPATIRRGVEAVLAGKAAATYWLLEQGGAVIAQLMITLEWSDWRAADVWWIQSVYVSPECRKQGHFKTLYRRVREECQEAGAAGLRLYADNGNQTAHAAYQRLGMTSHYAVFEDLFSAY